MNQNKHSDVIRINALNSYGVLDTLPEKIYDDITSLAASICKTKISLLTLITETGHFFKSQHGTNFNQTAIGDSFCRQMILENTDDLVIENTKKDAKFIENASVSTNPAISFYAGVSLITPGGIRLGALCVMDPKPKKLEEHQLKALHTLARKVIQLFEFRKISKHYKEQKVFIKTSITNEDIAKQKTKPDTTIKVTSAQETLKAKEQTDKIMNASLDIICTVDKDGYFLTINTACKRIWGYAPKELLGKKYIDFVYKNDKIATRKIEKEVISGKKITHFENRYIHKKKHLVPMRWSANWDNEDRIMYCIARDNTEHKKAEEKLEQSERRFKTLVQEGTELIAIFDQEANFIYVSPTSKKTLKMTPESLLGTNAFDHIHPDDHEAVFAQFLETQKTKQVYIKPFRFKNGEGKWRWLETIATNEVEEPSIMGIVVNTRDVTDRILHLKEIEEQNTALKAVAWNQSHIVRAPVARLMGLANLLKADKLEENEKSKILDYIIDSAEEIDTIIKKNVERATTVTNKS